MHIKKTGIGIIGTGAIASHHATAIRELDSCELVAVCSSSEARAASAALKFGVRAYYSVEDLLANPDVNLVIICTESGHHLEPAMAAARAGKHVLTEKPIEISLERAERMITECKAHGVKLGCVFQNRFKPAFLQLKEAVRQGRLGKLLMGNAYIKWYREPAYYSSSPWKGTLAGDGGAALINQGIHTIDLLLDLMQEGASAGIVQVYGQTRTRVHHIEGEDLGVALLSFEGGALGSVVGATALYPGYPERLEIYGEKGSVILEGGEIAAWNIRGEESPVQGKQQAEKSGSSDPMAVDYRLHKAQIQDMVEAIRNDREPLVSGETARRSLALIQAIYQSAKENRPVQPD